MQGGLVARKVSVCPSVKHVDCDKTEEKSVQIFIPYERSFSLVFWEKEWLLGWLILPEILGQIYRIGAKSPIFDWLSPYHFNLNRLHCNKYLIL